MTNDQRRREEERGRQGEEETGKERFVVSETGGADVHSDNSRARWKRWLRPSRLVPLVTIVGAGATIVLDFLRIVELSTAEEVIIALLALLAIDALTERISVLERIENKLRGRGVRLRDRNSFAEPLERRLASASEVCLVGVNLVGIISHHRDLMTARAKEGCRFRIVTLDPEFLNLSSLPYSWYGSGRKESLRYAMHSIERIIRKTGEDRVELRLARFPPPYSLLMIDPGRASGEVQVELYTHGRSTQERPHFILTRDIDSYWYDFFRREFELVWESSREFEQEREGSGGGSGAQSQGECGPSEMQSADPCGPAEESG
jgi:hypothetical protein